jgi:hypothetical protein
MIEWPQSSHVGWKPSNLEGHVYTRRQYISHVNMEQTRACFVKLIHIIAHKVDCTYYNVNDRGWPRGPRVQANLIQCRKSVPFSR